MDMTEERLVSLIGRQLTGELNPGEARELESWINDAVENKRWLKKLSADGYLEREIEIWRKIDPQVGFERWLAGQHKVRRSNLLRLAKFAVAASIIIVIATGVLLERRRDNARLEKQGIAKTAGIPAGKNTATLTLGNGEQVLLDSVRKGDLGMQGSSRVVKADNGSLAYHGGEGKTEAVVYNTLRTPRAGQYKLQLPDGSVVWLNNETSLTYPTSFQGKERTVELKGEAYFEVAARSDQPFVVKVRDGDIKVLGTSFNVMSYVEEGGTQTTLLTGAVAVKTTEAQVILKPNEQSQVKADGNLNVIAGVAGQDIVSWKDGFFYFGRSSFEAVMRQLARWYDVDVVYEGRVPEMEFAGRIDRSRSLDDLINFFDKNQIHLRLEGRKLVVQSN